MPEPSTAKTVQGRKPPRFDRATFVRGALEGVGLGAALLFVFLMGFIPHLDTSTDPVEGDAPGVVKRFVAGWEYFVSGEREGYPYTIHVDDNAKETVQLDVEASAG